MVIFAVKRMYLPKDFDKLENGNPRFRCVLNVKNQDEKHGLRKYEYFKFYK